MRALSTFVAAGLALTTFGVVGCSGDAEPADPPAPPVDLSALDVGSFKTAPRTIGTPNFDRARMSEGQRLGGYLPTASDVDSRFAYQSSKDSVAVFGFIEQVYTIGDSEKFKEDTPGFVAGFYSWGMSHDDILIADTLANTAMIFDSEQSAAAATDALAKRKRESKESFVPVDIPGFKGGNAFWDPARQELFAVTSYNKIVLYTVIKDYAMIEVGTTNLGALTTLAEKNSAAVRQRLSEFEPTPVDKLTAIEMDHDQLLGHSLTRPEGEGAKNPPGIYDRRGALHLSIDPISDKKLYEEAGLEWLGVNGTELYQAKDSDGAQLIAATHSALNKKLRSADSPKELPETKCNEYKIKSSLTTRFHCTLVYDRYVIEVRSNQLIDAHQRISAQYILLNSMGK